MSAVRIIGAIYLVLLAVYYGFQTRIIFPGAESQGQPYAKLRPPPGCDLVTLSAPRGEQIVAIHGPALAPDRRPDPQAASRPTLIYFYGNAMCASAALDQFEQFRRLGLNVIIPDYLGYGMSGGHASEKGCQATADAVYEYLLGKRGVAPERIIAGGWSLGAAVAIDLASRHKVGGLVACSAFTSGVDMGRRIAPFLPVSLLLRHRFESERKIKTIQCPILIGHGRADSLIPFEMGQKLASSAGGPVSTLWIEGAGHNDFFDVAGRRIDEAIVRFAAVMDSQAR
jgi:uncharacterized protein